MCTYGWQHENVVSPFHFQWFSHNYACCGCDLGVGPLIVISRFRYNDYIVSLDFLLLPLEKIASTDLKS